MRSLQRSSVLAIMAIMLLAFMSPLLAGVTVNNDMPLPQFTGDVLPGIVQYQYVAPDVAIDRLDSHPTNQSEECLGEETNDISQNIEYDTWTGGADICPLFRERKAVRIRGSTLYINSIQSITV